MKPIVLISIAILLMASFACSEVAITIYNNNLAVVKDTRDMVFPQGIGDIKFQDVASQIDATSVHFKATGAGQMTLQLVYHRSWEEGVAPLRTFSIDVLVR